MSEQPSEKYPETQKIDLEKIEHFFGNEGTLSSAFKQYEKRPQQIKMAREVGRLLNQSGFLLAEAGTGVGKSFAYLAPAAYWSKANPDERILISTHTKTLQNQLFLKDIPAVLRMTECPVRAVLLKGRNNYLCAYQWARVATGESDIPALRKQNFTPLFSRWMDKTETGDIDELRDFDPLKQAKIWRQLNCESTRCPGNQCPFFDSCYLYKARRKARQAQWVIINHALLIADMQAEFSVLGSFGSLILDEAHQLKQAALSNLGFSIHVQRFRRIEQMLTEHTVFNVLRNMIKGKQSKASWKSKVLTALDQLETLLQEMIPLGFNLLQTLKNLLETHATGAEYKKWRITEPTIFTDLQTKGLDNLIFILLEMHRAIERILQPVLKDPESLDEEAALYLQWLSLTQEQLAELHQHLDALCELDLSQHAVWIENFGSRDSGTVALQVVPLYFGEILNRKLYQKIDRCVMTSATLSLDGNYQYFREQLGLQNISGEDVSERIFGSPYHFHEQCLFLLPGFLPPPKAPDYQQTVSELLLQLIRHHAKGTMILFTSYKMMHASYQYISQSFSGDLPEILVQGMHGNRDQLLHQFVEKQPAVLMGTNSFWEGIDVAGPALELLVIAKIPFDVPSEPVIQAQIERIESNQGNGFMQFSVPEAVMRFRQGFGRLIRSHQDQGAVILLDSRVLHSRYGGYFLQSVPVHPVISSDPDDLIARIDQWF